MNDPVDDSRLNRILEAALLEDVGLGDMTSEALFPADEEGLGDVVLKEDGIIAGLEAAGAVFALGDPDMAYEALERDGAPCRSGTIVARVSGSLKGILKAERLALNILQRMSGIATLTAGYVQAVAGTHTKITDTRKTAPGLRLLDKWAVRLGGGVNHRFGLDDMILIKNNHVDGAGGIAPAIESCTRYLESKKLGIPVGVEARNLDEVREILASRGRVQRIMLDNFTPQLAREAVELIGRRHEVEASGGISLSNVRGYAEAEVDYISVGSLTHSVRAIDLSLSIKRKPPELNE